MNRQHGFITPDGEIVGVQKRFPADLPSNEMVVVLNVKNPIVPVIRTDIIDLVRTILLAADKTFQTENIFQFFFTLSSVS